MDAPVNDETISYPYQTTHAAVADVGKFDGCSSSSSISDGDWEEATTAATTVATSHDTRKRKVPTNYIDSDSDSESDEDASKEPKRKKTSHPCAFCSSSCDTTESTLKVSYDSASDEVYFGGKITKLKLMAKSVQQKKVAPNSNLVACKSCCDWQTTCDTNNVPASYIRGRQVDKDGLPTFNACCMCGDVLKGVSCLLKWVDSAIHIGSIPCTIRSTVPSPLKNRRVCLRCRRINEKCYSELQFSKHTKFPQGLSFTEIRHLSIPTSTIETAVSESLSPRGNIVDDDRSVSVNGNDVVSSSIDQEIHDAMLAVISSEVNPTTTPYILPSSNSDQIIISDKYNSLSEQLGEIVIPDKYNSLLEQLGDLDAAELQRLREVLGIMQAECDSIQSAAATNNPAPPKSVTYDNNLLLAEIEQLKSQLSSATTQVESLKLQLSVSKDETVTMRCYTEKLTDALRLELDGNQKEVVELGLECANLKSRLSVSEDEVTTLRCTSEKEIEALKLKLSHSKQDAEEWINKYNNLKYQLSVTQEELAATQKHAEQHAAQLQSHIASQSITSLVEKQLADAKKEVAELSTHLVSSVKERKRVKDAADEEIRVLKEQVSSYQRRVATLKSECDSRMDSKQKEWVAEYTVLQSQLSSAQNNLKRFKDSADEEITTLRTSVGTLKSSLAATVGKNNKHTEALKSQLDSSQKHVATLKSQLAVSQSQVASLSKATTTVAPATWAQDQLCSSQKQVEELKTLLSSSQKQVEELKTLLSSSQKQVEELKTLLSSSHTEIETLNRKIEEIKEQHKKVETLRSDINKDNVQQLPAGNAVAVDVPLYQLTTDGKLCPMRPLSQEADSIPRLNTTLRSVNELIQFKSKATRNPAIYITAEDGMLIPVFFEIHMEKLVLVDPTATLTTLPINILLGARECDDIPPVK